jgi:hypothetical protein
VGLAVLLGLAVLRVWVPASGLPSTNYGHPAGPSNAYGAIIVVLLCQSKRLLPLCPILQGALATGAVRTASRNARRAALAVQRLVAVAHLHAKYNFTAMMFTVRRCANSGHFAIHSIGLTGFLYQAI